MKPQVLESFRSNVKTKLQGGKPSNQSTTSVQYKGPSLSVSAIQIFKEDVYVCYNGSELRRFNFKVTFFFFTSLCLLRNVLRSVYIYMLITGILQANWTINFRGV